MSERNYQHIMWTERLDALVDFLNDQNVADYSSVVDFDAQRKWVQGLSHKCADYRTFKAECTRENLKKLCDTVGRVVGNGAALNHFPEWSYIVTQLHLFVIDAESKQLARGSHGMHPEPSISADGRALVDNTEDLLAQLVQRV